MIFPPPHQVLFSYTKLFIFLSKVRDKSTISQWILIIQKFFNTIFEVHGQNFPKMALLSKIDALDGKIFYDKVRYLFCGAPCIFCQICIFFLRFSIRELFCQTDYQNQCAGNHVLDHIHWARKGWLSNWNWAI